MASKAEIAWAAGLFEGEGCFYQQKSKQYRCFVMRLGMKDRDRVERFCEIVGRGKVYDRPMNQRADGSLFGRARGEVWGWYAGGEDARLVYKLLKPWLGPRRIERAEEILAA